MQYSEILGSVRERLGLDDDQATRAVVATTQALTERLSPSEAHDMLSQLPEELRRHVEVPTEIWVMDGEEFVDRVAQLEQIETDDAREHVRAVFAALREAVTYGEFSDVLDQLGSEYVDLLG